MEYNIKETGDRKVAVQFKGDITFSENVRFRQLLNDLADKDLSEGVFDLSGVDMVDSAGLGMFLIAKEQADTSNWKLTVEGASGHVASMLKLTKLSDLLEG